MSLWGPTLRAIFNRKRTPTPPMRHQPPPERLASRIDANFARIRSAFGESQDVTMTALWIHAPQPFQIGVVYIQGLADAAAVLGHFQELAERGLVPGTPGKPPDNALDIARNLISGATQTKNVADMQSLFSALLLGETAVLVDGFDHAFSANTTGGTYRAVEEPLSQSVVRGPREGFTESFALNVSMIRRRLRTPELWLETFVIGEVSRTSVGIMYVRGLAGDSIVEEVRIRLGRIQIDGILESGNIEELIQDETFTPFPTIYNTERPDVIAAGLLEGRVAILVDGTPFVLLAPALFVQFYQSAEDYYQRAEFATLIRMLRYVCFFISMLAPSLYIAVTTFHQELLPSSLLFSLAAQREGIPFPAFVEAVIMEVTFEILREAGVRLPKTIGQAVSIVGALVIGQAAVEAGLVSAAMVIVVAITAISNFVIPSFSMGISIRIIRFIMMVFAATFGLFGVTVGLIATVQHLCSLRSFGVPYLSPMAPFIAADQKDTILRLPLWGLFARPRFISQQNQVRENNAPTTKPERTGSP